MLGIRSQRAFWWVRVMGTAALVLAGAGAEAQRRSDAGAPETKGTPGATGTMVDLAQARLVDLTHPFDEKTLFWPNAPSGFQLTVQSHGKTEAGYFYAANSFCLPEHGGTHIDAPIHFAEKGRSVAEVPLRQLLARAVVIDVTTQAAANPDYRLDTGTVRAWEAEHGTIAAGSIVLLRTGWSARYPDRKRYFGSDTPGDVKHLHFPSYGADAAEFLVKTRKVAAIGVDTASIDHGPSQDFIVHRIVNGADVPGLENLTHLDELPPTGAWVVALPMKIAGGSGGPVRVIALLP
jgi:kynurenine formamidase